MSMHRHILSRYHEASAYIALSDAKAHLRVIGTDDDTYIASALDAAFDIVENYLTFPVRLTKVQFTDYSWAGEVTLPGRFHAFDSIKYYTDPGNVLTTLPTAEYHYLRTEIGLRIRWTDDATLPDTYEDRLDGVQYNVQMGWIPGQLPSAIAHAVLLNLTDIYEERKNTVIGVSEKTLTRGSEFLLTPYTQPRFV